MNTRGPLPSAKPPFAWIRVILACDEIGDREKLVLFVTYGLITTADGGAVVSAHGLARRLGRGHATIERARAELKDMQLLRSRMGSGRTATWFIELPPECRPKLKRPKDHEVLRLAYVLGERIRRIRANRTA